MENVYFSEGSRFSMSEQREALKRFNRLKREKDRLRKELGIKNTPRMYHQQREPRKTEESDEQPVAGESSYETDFYSPPLCTFLAVDCQCVQSHINNKLYALNICCRKCSKRKVLQIF